MARNRKHHSGAIRFVPAVKATLLCALIGGSAVGFVQQKNKIFELGRQIREREVVLERLKWENKVRASQLADLQLPHKLAQRIKDQNLDLVMPQPSQVVWLREPPEDKLTNTPAPLLVLGK
jgi:hypothetical protein